MYASQLLAYDSFDVEDDIDKELERCSISILGSIEGKTEFEVNNELQRKVASSTIEHDRAVDGLLYLCLTRPETAFQHFQTLSLCIRDNYVRAVRRLCHFSGERFWKLQRKDQVLWLVEQLIKKQAAQTELVVLDLLKCIRGGDTSAENVSLNERLLELLWSNRQWVFQFHGIIATSLYVFLRMIPCHTNQLRLKQKEIQYCLSLLKDKYTECSFIGRDLIRLLKDTEPVANPELLSYIKQLFHGNSFEKLLRTPTPLHFLQCHLPHEVESNIKFILEQVPWGHHDDIYFQWFSDLYMTPSVDLNNFLADVVRYIVTASTALNVSASPPIPRYAAVGKLLKAFKDGIVTSTVKTALFFDWIGFEPTKDNVLILEAGILMLERSIEKYPFISQWCLDHLRFMYSEYYPAQSSLFKQRVSLAIKTLLEMGVVRSYDKLINSPLLDEKSKRIAGDLFVKAENEIAPEKNDAKGIREKARQLKQSTPVIVNADESTDEMISEDPEKEFVAEEVATNIRKQVDQHDEMWMFGDLILTLKGLVVSKDEEGMAAIMDDIIATYLKMDVPAASLSRHLCQSIGDHGSSVSPFNRIIKSALEEKDQQLELKLIVLLRSLSTETPDPIAWRLIACAPTKKGLFLFNEIYSDAFNRLPSVFETLVEHVVDQNMLIQIILGLFQSGAEITKGNIQMIQVILSNFDANTFYRILWHVMSGNIQIFGTAIESFQILETTEWDTFAQYHFWLLLTAELSITENGESVACNLINQLLQHVQADSSEFSMGVLNLIGAFPLFCGRPLFVEAILVCSFPESQLEYNWCTPIFTRWMKYDADTFLDTMKAVVLNICKNESKCCETAFMNLNSFVQARPAIIEDWRIKECYEALAELGFTRQTF